MTSQALRNKRYRDRLRRGITHAHLEIARSIGESMIELGYLPEAEINDPKQIGEAFLRYWKEQYIRKPRP